MGRSGEIWGDVRRYGEISAAARASHSRAYLPACRCCWTVEKGAAPTLCVGGAWTLCWAGAWTRRKDLVFGGG